MTKQQTTLQTLIAWGDEMMKQEPMKVLSFAEAIDKAEELLEMEKEQIIDAWLSASKDSMLNPLEDKYYQPEAEQYYNETYGYEYKIIIPQEEPKQFTPETLVDLKQGLDSAIQKSNPLFPNYNHLNKSVEWFEQFKKNGGDK